MRDHNINQGSSSSLISIEMEVTSEALNSSLQGKLQAIMILVKDLDLVPGFTDHCAAILSAKMLNHPIFENPEIPTTVLVDRWNNGLFLL